MSGTPVQPRSRELEIVQTLFDKHLLERAVNLAEARWDGSGDMIRLAYHWRDLQPTERRERLEQIGPERLAQFRSLAELDPDLARVIDTLDERGVLTSVAPVTAEQITGDDPDTFPEPEPVVDEVQPSPVPEPQDHPILDDVDTIEPDATRDRYDEIRSMFDVDDPELGEVFPESFKELTTSEQDRHAAAVASGAEMLQRVRDRLDTSARRLTSTPTGSNLTAPTLPARMTSRRGPTATIVDAGEHTFTPPPEYWLNRLSRDRVVVIDGRMTAPTDDQLVAIANELGLEIAEFVAEPGETRRLFGGLRRSGGSVDVEIGPLPTALATPCLVTIRGRIIPKTIQRLRAGMCDIPGTRTSVRVDPDTRVLVIPKA